MAIIQGVSWQNGLKKHHTTLCYIKETHCRSKYTNMLKVKEEKKIFHMNNNQKRAWVVCSINIMKNRVEVKNCYKRQRRILYIDIDFNSPR